MSIFEKLAAPFDPAIVSWRVGSTTQDKSKGMALAFIDARDVMMRLDAVVGPQNWQRRYPWSDNKRICCEIGIKVDDEWVWKSDGCGDSDVEAEKGAFSDAFKRAAVSWGIGRYLYFLDAPWVKLEPLGRSYKIADNEKPRLRAILADQAKGGANTPANAPAPPPPPSEDASDWPAYIEGFKRDFLASGSYLRSQEYWSAQAKPLRELKLARPQAYSALVAWAKTEGDKLPREAC